MAPNQAPSPLERPSGSSDADDAFVRRLLETARARTGMEVAWLSRLAEGRQSYWYTAGGRPAGPDEGSSGPADGSYCQRLLDGRLPPLVPDAAGDPRTAALPATRELAIGSYIGVPVRLGEEEEPFGTLACVSSENSDGLGMRDVGFLEALASLVGSELARQAQRQRADEHRRQVVLHALEAGLEIVFQPIVDLRTAVIVGAEALARFAVPPAGPEAWFSDAGDAELGQALQLAAAAEALRHIDELPDEVYLAVNVSPALIVDQRLHDLMDTVPAGRIVLEITEHAAVDDYEELAAGIERLRARGARLAIDDAGAGFSSLRHVLRLRPDIIKLDMSITRNVDSDPVRRALAEALVTFAGVIGASIVAEGVETRGELDALLALGADSAQGFFLRRPSVLPLPDSVPGPTPSDLALPGSAAAVDVVDLARSLGEPATGDTGSTVPRQAPSIPASAVVAGKDRAGSST